MTTDSTKIKVKNAWQDQAKKLAEHAVRHLLNRNDGMGAYGDSAPYTRKITQEISEARTEEIQRLIVSHFAGRKIGGIHTNSAFDADGKWTARFGCIDLDLKAEHPYKEMRRQRNHEFAVMVQHRLAALGIQSVVEDSNGRGGYHIWFWLTGPIDVARLYAFLQSLVADAEEHGFERQFQRVDADGNGLIHPNGKPNYGSDLPETFPKQDTPTGEGFGNWMRLPGKHHTYDHWSRIWGDGEWLTIEDSVDAWLSLPAADVALIPELPADEPEAAPVAPAKASVAVVHSNAQDKIGTIAERTIETESWNCLLQGAGWKLHSENGAESKWTRPGKDGGVSATLNFNGNNLLTVFTTAVSGLNQNGSASETFGKWRFYCWSNGFENRQVEAAKEYLPADVVAEHDRKSAENWLKQEDASSGVDISNLLRNDNKTEDPPIGGKKLLTKSAWDAVENPVPKRPVVIDGLMRRGDVANIIASTKVGKSWFAVLLAFCVATGRDWLGRGVAKGNVLLIDNELYDADIQNRLSPVAHAMGVLQNTDHARFDYAALRGNLLSITDLETLLMQYEPGDLTLIVMDAKYRFFGELEENSNEDQTTFHNIIDRVAKHLECVIVLIHHSTKGDQSGKSVTDVGSGGGAQSRAADCHLVLRPHAEDGLAVLDAAVRTFAPVEPQTIRWNFPLWTLEEGVEAILKADKSRGDSRQDTKDREAIGVLVKVIREEKGEPKTAYDLRKKVGCGQDKINRLIRVGLDDGTFVVTGTRIGRKGDNAELITLPVYADHYFMDSRTSEMNV